MSHGEPLYDHRRSTRDHGKKKASGKRPRLISRKRFKKSILQNLGTVDTTFISQGRHPSREGDILADGTGIGFGTISDCIRMNDSKGGACIMFDLRLRSGGSRNNSLILQNCQAAVKGIGDKANDLVKALTGGNAGIDIWDFRIELTTRFCNNSSVVVEHIYLLGEGRASFLVPLDVGLFEDVSHVVFIEVVPFNRYCNVCFGIEVNIVASSILT